MSIRRKRSRSQAYHRAILRSCALLAVVAAAPQLALAQPAGEEIIVTGSRVARTGFDSPQPLTTIDAKQIEDLGIVNVGDVVRTMPQNTPFFTETNVGIGNFNVGAQLANLRGLNPFFGTRTLTLVDTKRVIPNSEGGAVDLTLIPSMLVERTEVVTGGASAAYGSDAIAGVVNVILDKDFEGFKAQFDLGQTTESDGDDTHAAFAFGTAFADQDRGHVIVGAEYQSQDAIPTCSRARDWCREGWMIGTNAAFNTPAGVGNGQPNFVVVPNSKFATSENGLFTPFGGALQQFNTAGTALLPYNPGQYPGGFIQRSGGDGTVLGYDISGIRPDVERYTLMAHMSYDVSDRLEFFAEVAHAHSDAVSFPANGALGPIALAIAPDNAFLSPAVQAAAPFGGLLARIFMPDVQSARNTTENDTTRFVTGLQGELAEKWRWDAYYQHGENENHQRLFHNVVGALLPPFITPPPPYNFLGWALDAVRSDPLNPNSTIVCRATLPGAGSNPLAAGCVPLNLFGIGNASQAAIDYAYRTLVEDSDFGQDVIGANFRSTIAEGWAGPIAFAAGAELRNEDSRQTHDLPNQPWARSFFLTWSGDRGGEIDVSEAYAEIEVPMAKKLQTNFAVRRTHNDATSDDPAVPSSTHDFTSWKASAIYDPLEWLRLRTTLSRDVRAAGFRELFLPRTTVTGAPGGFPGGINNPWNSNIQETYQNTSGGNPNLSPETADTTTLGVVLSFDRFRFSADWFEIDLVDAISPGGLGGLSAQQLVDGCFASGGLGAVCAKVTGFGTMDIAAVDATSINIGQFLTHGYDLEANYRVDLRSGANLNLRMIGTYLNEMRINGGLGVPPRDYEGQSGPVASFGGFNTSPNWQTTAWLTYSHDRFTTTLEARYVGSGKLNSAWIDSLPGSASNTQLFTVSDNSVDDAYYFGWFGSYDFRRSNDDRKLQLFWAVNNLFDKDPPVAPGGNVYPTNPVFFDTIGRRFRAGVRIGF